MLAIEDLLKEYRGEVNVAASSFYAWKNINNLAANASSEIVYMQFKKALKAAGLAKPGRTTWCGTTPDKLAVFTIWENEIHKPDGRWFAWWNHAGARDSDGELMPRRKASARAFISLAAHNIRLPCRAVIVKPRYSADGTISSDSATYPHPLWSTIVFRAVDQDASQFIAELLPV